MDMTYVHVMPQARIVLSAARMLVGVSCWLAPDQAARFFGIDPDHANRFVTRLFGARDLALGAALLAAPTQALRPVAALGAGIDLVDTVAGWHEGVRGTLTARAIILGPGGALAFAALGGLVLRRPVATART